jgi:ABC-type transport system substrate-binding protein
MMKKNLFYSLVFGALTFIASCSGDNSSNLNNQENNINKTTKDVARLDFAITEKYQTLDPTKVLDVVSFHINSQIYECLLRFDDHDLSLQPMLAKSWEVSEDDLVYTFNLRKGVYFHDNPCFNGGKGRELKSSDVLYTFKRIYSNSNGNYGYSMFKNLVVGSENFYNDKTPINEKELEGIKLIDDYTIQITLNQPYTNFLELMASLSSAIVSSEAIEKKAIVGTGPFVYNKEGDTAESIVLNRNSNYYLEDKEGNKLPYLSSVAYNYVKSGQEQMDLFIEGKLDIVTNLPPESVKEIVNNQIADFQDKPVKYVLGRYPQISTSYLSFNNAIAPLNNKKVRQALAYAIDKNRIVNNVLKGEAFGPGDYGIIPPAINGYDYSSVIGLEYNVEKAKKLLAEAGYQNGEGFPTLQFITGQGNTSVRVALDIQKQLLANLNLNIEITSTTLAEALDMEKYAKGHITLSAWLADFPDPVSFLTLFYGENVPNNLEEPSYVNRTRYKNETYDKLYLKALGTKDLKQKYELCLQADQIIAEDVPVIPLWYHENYRLIQGSVKGYQPNTMNIQYLTYVKIEMAESKK